MEKFKFNSTFESLTDIKDIKGGDKRLTKLCMDKEVCLGNRQVGTRSYHIFYFAVGKQFCLYYHGGGTDAMFTTKSLDEMLDHINGLTE